MLSLEQCRKILQKGDDSYTEDEILMIRELLQNLCEIEYEIYKETESEDTSSPIH